MCVWNICEAGGLLRSCIGLKTSQGLCFSSVHCLSLSCRAQSNHLLSAEVGGGFGFLLEGTTAFNIRNFHGNLNTYTKITGLYAKSASGHWSQNVLKSALPELKGGQSTLVNTRKVGSGFVADQTNNTTVAKYSFILSFTHSGNDPYMIL